MRKTVPVLVGLALLAAACGSGGGGGANPQSEEPIKVGLVVPLTGAYTALGKGDRQGAEIAVQRINDAGGINGRTIKLMVKDGKTEPNQAVLDFNDVVGDGAVAVVGPAFSNSALAMIPQSDRKKVPFVSLAPADEQVNPIHDYTFMVPAAASTYAEENMRWFQAEGISRIAIAYDSKAAYGTTGFKTMKREGEKYGLSVVDTEPYETNTTDFSTTLAHVRKSDAQALMVWGSGPAPVILTKQFASSGLDIPLVGTGAQGSTLYTKPAGKAAEGVVLSASIGVVGPALPKGALKTEIMKLVEPYRKKYGGYPPQFAFDGYSGVMLLAAAIKKAGSTDAADIQRAFEGLSLLTPNGRYEYSPTDHSGLRVDETTMVVVKDGDFAPTDWAKTQFKKLPSG
ncbi:MAG: ABC transporter substrate-binding protein [Nocardioidaceae bacterium]